MAYGMIRIVAAVVVCLGVLAADVLIFADANAQSALRVARGLSSNNITVLVNRAVVIESVEPFVEVSVANPETADVSPLSDRSVYIFGRTRGVTTLTLLGQNGRLITNVTINVEPDLGELKKRLGELLPREEIEVRSAADGLVLSGTVSGKQKITRAMELARAYGGDSVINMMSVGGTQQVMLKVKVAEISRGAAKDIGVSIGLLGNTQRTAPFSTSGESITIVDDADGTDIFENATSTLGTFGGIYGAVFSIANSFLLDIQIDALETKGFAKTLSEPNLITLSGTEANFLAGGEVPIPIDDGDGEVTIEFKPVGVDLNFTPNVLDDDLISVALSAEVSEVDPTLGVTAAGFDIPGFQVRRATTTVQLRDGQAFAVAGLLQESFTDSISQVPFLGDIPVLGALFRSADYQRGESELIIIVSAHLVTPVDSADDLALPTDRIEIPNEAELFWLGRPTGNGPGGSFSVGMQGFDGQYGYVLE